MGRASVASVATCFALWASGVGSERPSALDVSHAWSPTLPEPEHEGLKDAQHNASSSSHDSGELSPSLSEEEPGVVEKPEEGATQALEKLGDFYNPSGGEMSLLLDKIKTTDWKLNRAAWNWTRKNTEAVKAVHHVMVQATNNASNKYFEDGLRFNQALRDNLLNETKVMDALSLDERARQRILHERGNGSRIMLPPEVGNEALIGARVKCSESYSRKRKDLVRGQIGRVVSLVPATNKFRIKLKRGGDFMPTLFKNEFVILPEQHPEFDGVDMDLRGDFIDVPDEHETERLQILAIYEDVPVRIDHVPDHIIRDLHEKGKDAEVLYLHKIGKVHNYRREVKPEFQIELDDMEEELWPWLEENRDFHRVQDLEGQDVVVNKVSQGNPRDPASRTVIRTTGRVQKWHPEAGGYYSVVVPELTVNVRPNEIRRDRSAYRGGYGIEETVPDVRYQAPHGKMLLDEEVQFTDPDDEAAGSLTGFIKDYEPKDSGPHRPADFTYRIEVPVKDHDPRVFHLPFAEFQLTSPKWAKRMQARPPEFQEPLAIGTFVKLNDLPKFPPKQVGNGIGTVESREEPSVKDPMLSTHDDAGVYTMKLLDRNAEAGTVTATRSEFQLLDAMMGPHSSQESIIFDSKGFLLQDAAAACVGHAYAVSPTSPGLRGLDIPNLHLPSNAVLPRGLILFVYDYVYPNWILEVPGLGQKEVPSNQLVITRDLFRVDPPEANLQPAVLRDAVIMVLGGIKRGRFAQLECDGPDGEGRYKAQTVEGYGTGGQPMLGPSETPVTLQRSEFVPLRPSQVETMTKWILFLLQMRELRLLTPENIAEGSYVPLRTPTNQDFESPAMKMSESGSLGSGIGSSGSEIAEEGHCGRDQVDPNFGEPCCSQKNAQDKSTVFGCNECQCPSEEVGKVRRHEGSIAKVD